MKNIFNILYQKYCDKKLSKESYKELCKQAMELHGKELKEKKYKYIDFDKLIKDEEEAERNSKKYQFQCVPINIDSDDILKLKENDIQSAIMTLKKLMPTIEKELINESYEIIHDNTQNQNEDTIKKNIQNDIKTKLKISSIQLYLNKNTKYISVKFSPKQKSQNYIKWLGDGEFEVIVNMKTNGIEVHVDW